MNKTMRKLLKIIKKVTKIETKVQHYQGRTENLDFLFITLQNY